ncbi:RNA-directed DNA polymerase, eukaryota [Tanacetum coccineum]
MKAWTPNTFNKVSAKWGELIFVEDKENMSLNSKRICIKTKLLAKDGTDNDIEEGEFQSEDPFNIYPILNKTNHKRIDKEVLNTKESLEFPPGFTPNIVSDKKCDYDLNAEEQLLKQHENVYENINGEYRKKGESQHPDGDRESNCSGSFRKSIGPTSGGSILDVLEEVIKVGQTMGYKMDGCASLAQKAKKDWVKGICNIHKVNFLSLQETKMESIDVFGIKNCWGNYSFEHVCGPSVGNSGGDWIPNAKKLLIISVYAPQDVSEKRMLWSYLKHLMDRWRGETIIMGDFNEVRFKEERFGTNFNRYSAGVFNSFISSGGLVEVPLGGCEFTWCHKSGTKMSKLDRFLISEGLMGYFPSISAITLDRYLSDHRPILLREACFDYGPTPFRLFHYWFDWDGFDTFVRDTWFSINISDYNAMSRFSKKLRYLKEQIKVWVRTKKERDKANKTNLKGLLKDIDRMIDEKQA